MCKSRVMDTNLVKQTEEPGRRENVTGNSLSSGHSGALFIYLLFYFPYPHLRTCLLIFRERGMGRERERNIDVREKHRLVASCTQSDQGQNLQPRYEL